MNSGFYQNFELTCTAIAWRRSFLFHFFSEGKLTEYFYAGRLHLQRKCSQKPDLVSRSGCKQNCHFNIVPHIPHKYASTSFFAAWNTCWNSCEGVNLFLEVNFISSEVLLTVLQGATFLCQYLATFFFPQQLFCLFFFFDCFRRGYFSLAISFHNNTPDSNQIFSVKLTPSYQDKAISR